MSPFYLVAVSPGSVTMKRKEKKPAGKCSPAAIAFITCTCAFSGTTYSQSSSYELLCPKPEEITALKMGKG